MQTRSWSELSPGQRIGTVLLGILELALFGAAQWDLTRRPDYEIKGPKRLWRALVFINIVGPLAYFLWGRKD